MPAACIRCGEEFETMMHVFRDCSTSLQVWSWLQVPWAFNNSNDEFTDWITQLFTHSSSSKRGLIGCTIWMLQGNRNTVVHEQKIRSDKMIADPIIAFLEEIDEIKIKKLTVSNLRDGQKPLIGATVKVNFDGSFDICNSKSCSGVVVRDSSGEVLFSRSIIQQNVTSPFAVDAIACFQALRTCNEGNWSNIEIEGDALSIIRKCNSNKENRSSFNQKYQPICEEFSVDSLSIC